MNARISDPALVGLFGLVLALAAGEFFLFDGVRSLRSEASTMQASLVSEVSGVRMSTSLANDARGEQLEWLRAQVQEAIGDVQAAAGLAAHEAQWYARQLGARLALKQRHDQDIASRELSGARQAAERAQAAAGALAGEVYETRAAMAGAASGIDSAGTDIIGSRADLAMLGAGAAANARGLLSLSAAGERAYYEFDLRKGEQASTADGVAIVLRKANPRQNRYTIDLIAGNRVLEKKDRELNEPVTFFVSAHERPYEVVVNSIGKDRITGYISAPKFTWLASNY